VIQCDGAWWWLLAGLPWIPPFLATALPSFTNPLGTSSQAHLLVMSLTLRKISFQLLTLACKPRDREENLLSKTNLILGN